MLFLLKWRANLVGRDQPLCGCSFLPRAPDGVNYLWLCTVSVILLHNWAETECSCVTVRANCLCALSLIEMLIEGQQPRFIMRGCHWTPTIQDWTNNKSFVLQLGRINEVLLNMAISHNSTMQKAALTCTTCARLSALYNSCNS